MISVEFDARDFEAAASLFPQAVAAEFGQALDQISADAVASGKATTRYRNRTGRLRRSTKATAKRTAVDYATVDVKAGGGAVHYARYVEDGTSRMAPRRYMYFDVYRANRELAPKAFEAAMARVLDSLGLG